MCGKGGDGTRVAVPGGVEAPGVTRPRFGSVPPRGRRGLKCWARAHVARRPCGACVCVCVCEHARAGGGPGPRGLNGGSAGPASRAGRDAQRSPTSRHQACRRLRRGGHPRSQSTSDSGPSGLRRGSQRGAPTSLKAEAAGSGPDASVRAASVRAAGGPTSGPVPVARRRLPPRA